MAYLYLKLNAPKLSVSDMNRVVGNNPQFSVSSTSGASTALTINTSTAHGLNNGDSVVVNGLLTAAGVPVVNAEGPVEGVYVVSSVASTSFIITISSAITTAQAASGAISKFTGTFSNALTPIYNLIMALQGGAIDGIVQCASSDTAAALPPSSSTGAINNINLK
jgi:hypothetical protein